MGTIYVVYSSTADAGIVSTSATYLTARAQTTVTTTSNTTASVANAKSGANFSCAQSFLVLDTSAVPAGGGTGLFSLNVTTFSGNPDVDTVRFRQVSSVANKIAGASLAAQTLLCNPGTFPTGTGVYTASIPSIYTFPRSATLNVVIHTVGEENATVPAGLTNFIHNLADVTGTTNDPYVQFDVGSAWEFVGVSNEVAVATTAHALVTTGISGTLAAGDLLVACITSRIASTTSVTLPTGGEWTLVAEQKNNNTLTTSSALPSGLMAYCVRGASNPNLTFTHPVAPSQAQGRIVAYRNVNTASPKDTQTSFTTATAQTAVTGTGLTTTQIEDLIVAMACGGQEAAWSAFNATDPAGASGATVTTAPTTTWSERADSLVTTGADGSLAIFDAVKLTSGATGNLTATASVSAGHVVIAGAFKIYAPPAGDGVGDADGVGAAAATGAAIKSADASTASGTGSASATGTGIKAANASTAAGVGAAAAVGTTPQVRTVVSWVELSGTSSVATVSGAGTASGVGAAAAVGASTAAAAGLSGHAFAVGHTAHIYLNTTGLVSLAQSFTASGELVRAQIRAFNDFGGTTDNLTVKIYATDASHFPTGAQIGGTATVLNANIPTVTSLLDFIFPAPIKLVPATEYAIVVEHGSSANELGIGFQSLNQYPGGQLYQKNSSNVWSSAGAGYDIVGTLYFSTSAIGAASAVGTGIAVSVGTAAGIGTVAAEGAVAGITSSTQGTAAGIGAAAATGTGIKAANASTASGLGTATATAAATAASVGDADGIGAASGVGFSITVVAGAGDADGVGAATAAGRSTGASVGDADGIGTAAATATATAASVGTAAGTGAALALSDPGTTTGEATGQGTATATGRAITVGIGAASGVGSASATGAVIAAGVGAASGTGTAAAVSEEAGVIAEGVGTAAGVGEAIGRSLEEQLPIAGGGGGAIGFRPRPRPAVIEGVGYAVLPEFIGFAIGEVGYRPKAIAGRARGVVALTGHCVCDIGVKGAAYSIARLPLMASATMDAGSAGQAQVSLSICKGAAMGDHDPDEHVVIALTMAA